MKKTIGIIRFFLVIFILTMVVFSIFSLFAPISEQSAKSLALNEFEKICTKDGYVRNSLEEPDIDKFQDGYMFTWKVLKNNKIVNIIISISNSTAIDTTVY